MVISNIVSQSITNNLVICGNITDSDSEAFKYCIDYMLELTVYFLITFLIGLLGGYPLLGIMNFIIMIPIRSVCGGYHSSTRFGCAVLSYGYYLLMLISLHYYSYITNEVWCVLFIIGVITIHFNPKAISRNNFTHNQHMKHIILQKLISITLCVCYYIAYTLHIHQLYQIISICTFFALLSILASYFTGRTDNEL